MLISLLSSTTHRRRVGGLDPELLVEQHCDAHLNSAGIPSFDVFLPMAGEPLDVLDNTYRYVTVMEWPTPTRVYVLDDAAREEVGE